MPDTYLEPLIKLRKKCARLITFSHYLECSLPLFKQLDILSFKKLEVQRKSLLMFKRHIGITHLSINNLFIVNTIQHAYYTRQINGLQIQIGNIEKVYKLFSFHGISMSYACYNFFSKR